MFDESFNSSTKSKQLDLHVRFWSNGEVRSRYMGSQFMGHGTAQDLLKHIEEASHQLDRSRLISVSMDGPNVNLKLLDLLQQDHAEKYGGTQLVSVGSCGLHTLHNSFKVGFSMWNVDKILKAMHTLFHNVPARREDYEQVTKSALFPKPFCGHRWLENLPVVERALEVWPSLMLYMDAVHKKQLPNPKTASFDTIEAAIKDPLTTAKMHFFMTLARTFHPFMKKYQTDEPVMPLLAKDLAELIKSLLRRCIKREVLQDITPLQLTKLDTSDKTFLLLPQKIDIGLGAEAAVKVPLTKELMASVGAARSKYRLFLDQERIRKEKESQSQKRKLAEQCLVDLKKRKTNLEDVSACLVREADALAEQAEGKAGSKMAQLLSKSNALRRAHKDKLGELKALETEIDAKGDELRHM
ncbi:hypothetical protein AALO_G00166480 [Alosa alosa]|uniref:Uncharacterized protein n=1 Tax=Alosa alosa TaxID=278164 RepID=A0AAV6GBL7_9TELE|nr:hypothetical protein AALO_G00166480 [Alosa alosa]